jgi:hypothetical protein
VKDWLGWHRAYDDPRSSLARRLEVVKGRLGEALERVTATEPKVLGLCAGDGRDVIPVLAARAASSRLAAVLVEQNPTLARRASESSAMAGRGQVQVRCGDAGDPASFADVLLVDVLMLCGIFGNIEHRCVKHIIDLVPRLVVPGGYVIWTRGGSMPDRRPEVRQRFRAAGLDEVAFDGTPESYGVGLNQLRRSSAPADRALPDRLFTFV